ncbi:hypothetical protein P3X46_007557 [Hevea brasiliensis]|uniref:F-box/LRR-repeat protein 15-like leucin rich repeat domain-containing protein n=1 Tax=Hevea brasiliensis TaxID=3981 RepID=A0ABQ9MXQ7_HEVBR|nr:uncharacterized protein LOC110640430 [Hevea brasiliensis]KAJ9183745.1 hypothetical protein P3X46_007557 [Hevea brasiliensis]
MVVLRSREVLLADPAPKPQTNRVSSEPVTPVQLREPSIRQSSPSLTPNLQNHQLTSESASITESYRRRSLRLAYKSIPVDGCIQNGSPKTKGSTSKRSIEENEGIEEQNAAYVADQIANEGSVKDNGAGMSLPGILNLRSGKRATKRFRGDNSGVETGTECEDKGLNFEENGSAKRSSGQYVTEGKGKGKLRKEEKSHVGQVGENLIDNGIKQMVGDLERGKRSKVDVANEKLEEKKNIDEGSNSRGRKGCGREEIRNKGEDAVVTEQLGKTQNQSSNSRGRRTYSREEKGKEKLIDDASVSNGKDALELELKSKVKEFVDSLGDKLVLENERQTRNSNTRINESRMEQFRDIARKNASRFAHFDLQEEEEPLSPQVGVEMTSVEENQQIEDWPGPFSTAMKIIRDRTNKHNSQQCPSTLEKAKSMPITWIPRNSQGSNRSRAFVVPSLQELCMNVLVKNYEAVTSLEHIPDALRHRLCRLLCDCRKMNCHFLDLLVRGSPTEIRVKDCSWLTEEEFVKCFEDCDTSNLTVLQLDQCGRCMPDYVLPATLARSSRSLPVLITLSLAGACRLSDVGLSLLVSSAPTIRSINLSQCSLLTSTSIDTLADSLGSVLRELYIDDCQSLDPMLILPALKKFEHLEVLSLAGNPTVCDDFVRQFVVACGHNMKELVLANCVKLTDSSMKIIAETCPGLCALHLDNLRKLTDSGLGYLANGCRGIQTLKLCLNAFSDEAIAAFVETAGELLKELSLNNVKKVGNNTALSLARHSRNLLSLDLSWCRNLADEAVGLIVDSCLSLRVLKLFGCSQITNVFLDGHSNPELEIIGLKMSPVLEHIWAPDSQEFLLRYSSMNSSM